VPVFELGPEVDQLVAAAARLAQSRLAPEVRAHEAEGRWPEPVLAVLRNLPLGGLDLPAELGGAEAGCPAKAAVLEALAGADAGGLPAADQPGASAGALALCPDRPLAAQVAEACLAGRAQCALAVACPGEDPPARLAWVPGWPDLRWVWVSAEDDLRLVEVSGEVGDEAGDERGPTVSAGVGAEPGSPTLAFQASGAASCDLAGGRTVGEWTLAPGEGLVVRGRARLWGAAVALGVARAALAATLEYTTERVVFGRPVAHHQGNAFELAAAAARLHGAGLAVRDAASRLDDGDPDAGFWATQAWVETMDTAFTVTDLGIQLLGGHGFLMDHLAEKRFREARMLALLHGGRAAAGADLAYAVLDVADPVLAGGARPGGAR